MESGKSRLSRFMTYANTSPPAPQPKHFHSPVVGFTWNEGLFSWWNGQQPQ